MNSHQTTLNPIKSHHQACLARTDGMEPQDLDGDGKFSYKKWFHGDFMGFDGDLLGFNGDLMGFNGDLMGFSGI